MVLGVGDCLRRLVQLKAYQAETITLGASETGGVPEDGWEVPLKGKVSVMVTCTKAATFRLQGRMDATDEWATLQKDQADGDNVWTFVAKENGWIGTDKPRRFIRVSATDTSATSNDITAICGAR